MDPELSASLNYFLQEDIYLLPADRDYYLNQPELSAAVEEETPAPEFKYMGGYKKGVLIISYYPGHEHIEAAHLTALESTLKRIGLVPEDVAILNAAAHKGISYELMETHLSPVKVIILGKDALPDNAPAMVLNSIQDINGKPVLYTFSFGEMIGNKENTKLFWSQIKDF